MIDDNALDRLTLATSLRRIAHAAAAINEILQRNDQLNESIPDNWPLAMSADEFAAECFAAAEHYETEAKQPTKESDDDRT